MEKGFKKLLGNRLYITLPPKEKSNLTVDANTKEALQKELLLKMSRLKIFAVGAGVVDPDFVEGAEVLIDPIKISSGIIVPLSADHNVLMVSAFDVIHIW